MKPKKLDPQRVILVPADEAALELGVGSAAEVGKLQALLTVTTAELGQFVIPLSAHHVGLMAAWGKRCLNLTAEEVASLRDNLTNFERNIEDE